jgi:hypothetical protein
VDELLVDEAHLSLRGMDVDVDLVGRELEEQVDERRPGSRGDLAVGFHHRVVQDTVFHRPSVDEEVEPARGASGFRRRGQPGLDRKASDLLLENDGALDPALLELIKTLAPRSHRGSLEHRALSVLEPEPHVGIGGGEARDRCGDVGGLGHVGAKKLAPRGNVEEQPFHLHDRPRRNADGRFANEVAPLERDFVADVGFVLPGLEDEARHRCDGGKGLAAKTERGDVREVAGVEELARRMPREREPRVLGRHADAVVGDADAVLPAPLDRDRDRPGSGIERVLDELLYDRSRPLHHFTRGDLVREGVGHQANASHTGNLSCLS